MKIAMISSSIAAASAAQSVLRAGDCAVVAVKTDDPDHFSVVLTRALKEGDVLYATDAGISQNAVTHRYWQWTRKGWYWTIEQKTVTYKTAEEFYGNGGFREVSDKSWYSYEGFGKFVTPRGGLAAGSIITSEMFETSMKKDGLTHGKLMLSNAGDQVFIFNGPMKEVKLTRREQCGTTRQPYKQSYSQSYRQRYCSRSRWGRCRQYSYRNAYRTATRTAYRNIPKYCNKVYGKRIQPVHKETNKVNFLCGATTSVQGYASYSWSSTHTKTPPGLTVHKTTSDLRACTSSQCTHVRHYDNWMYKGSTSGTREQLLKKINAAPYLNRGRNTQWKWTNSGNVAKAYPQAIKNMRWNVLMKVHCMVSENYGECSVPCGPGTKTKTVIQYAANGGNQCKKSDLAPVSCNLGSCSEAPTMAPTNAPTNFCDASNCNNWDCAAWCKCYDEENVEAYSANGCADDGDTSCVCFEGKDVSDDEHRVAKMTAEKTTKPLIKDYSIPMNTQNFKMVGAAKESHLTPGGIYVSAGAAYAETLQSFEGPIDVSVMMKQDASVGGHFHKSIAECGVVQVFPQANVRHTGYNAGTHWWRTQFGAGVDGAIAGRGSMGSDGWEWNTVRVRVLGGRVEYYLNGDLRYSASHNGYTSGKIRLGFGCMGYDFKELSVTPLTVSKGMTLFNGGVGFDQMKMVGGAKESHLTPGAIYVSAGSGYAESDIEFQRPIDMTVMMKQDKNAGGIFHKSIAECGVVQVFPQANARHTGYNAGTSWWRTQFGAGVDGAIAGRGSMGNNGFEWNKIRINAKADGKVDYYMNGKLMYTAVDNKYQSGKIRVGFGCMGYEFKDITINSKYMKYTATERE